MAYQPAFLSRAWEEYLRKNNVMEAEVDPDAFIRWTYAQALAHRQPRYEAMAKWGIRVSADEVARATDAASFETLIATAIDRRRA